MPGSADHYRDLLLDLGRRVRAHVMDGRNVGTDSRAAGYEGGDLLYAIDRRIEPLIVRAFETARDLPPTVLVCEGLGENGRAAIGEGAPRFRVMIDPIDGTRSLMYDKRSGWFLACVAPDKGEATRMSDAVASVMVELPTSKQGFADMFWLKDGRAEGVRVELTSGSEHRLAARPSGETELRNGFGQVVSFFPGTKRLAADLMERIAEHTLGVVSINEASVFDDQYICTGGEMVELMCGRDRFCADLRPIFYDILARDGGERDGLCCHPYDMAGAPVAAAAGVVLTDGYGQALSVPFDVSTGVHWCGYANEALRRRIEPVIQEWIAEQDR
jgi:hypothetical protein